MNELRIRGSRDEGSKFLPYGRLIIATAGVLATTGVLSCAVVFAMSVLIRNNGPLDDRSSADAMFLAGSRTTIALLESGKSSREFHKSSRLPIMLSRKELTTNAIVEAYQRAQANPTPLVVAVRTQALGADFAASASPQSTITASISGTEAASPVANAAAVPDAQVQPDKLPIPEARPAFDWRHEGSNAQKKLPSIAAPSKATSQAAEQLASLPSQTAPDTTSRSGFDWLGGNSKRTAVYDISAGVVYLPNGEKLEAHSGGGRMRDNPSFVNVKMLGPTPPATYALSMREASFHGVDAIRLTPIKGVAPFGREGLLAHTYMLRRPGDSNGCVVFANYDRFLKAYRNNEINYITVVPQLQDRITMLDKLLPLQG